MPVHAVMSPWPGGLANRPRWPAVAVRVALAIAVGLPLFGGLLNGGSIAARLVVSCLFVLALVQPANALLAVAGLLILGTPLGALLRSPTGLEEPLVLSFLCGWLLHSAIRPAVPLEERDVASRPALLLAAVVAAACLVQIIAGSAVHRPLASYVRTTATLLVSKYLDTPGELPALAVAAPMLEGIALFAAANALGRHRLVARRALRLTVVGGAGLAVLNLVRLVSATLRSGAPFGEASERLRGVRISVLGDYNAVGSYLVMVLFVSVGVAFASRRGRSAWAVLSGFLLAALWLTRSRAALLAVPVAALVFPAEQAARRGVSILKPLISCVAVFALVIILIGRFFPPDAGLRPAANMVQDRLEMARVSFVMVQADPVFGVGLGRFWGLSGRYIRPPLRTVVPNENAHNNFLQILAELGIVGLITFLWLLTAVGRPAWRALAAKADPLLLGGVAGLVAFLVTCLAGHPLLMRTVAYAFWLTLGLVAAVGGEQLAERRSSVVVRPSLPHARGTGVFVAVLLASLAISVPIRASREMGEADLSNVSTGFSHWRTDGEGRTYRTFARRATFYVERTICAVAMPMRADGKADFEVEIRLDGRIANRVDVSPLGWSSISLLTPVHGGDSRFRTIELRVVRGAPDEVRVGQLDLKPCSLP